MSTKEQSKQDKQEAEQSQQARQRLTAIIGRQVMRGLGQPGDLHRVQVRHLWQDCYRVNVVVGVDGPSPRVAHSYFLVADDGGNILESTPAITKSY